MVARVAVLLALLASCGEETCPAATPLEPGDERAVRVVTANIGNGMQDPAVYALKQRWQRGEDAIGARLRALEADVVALQEVLAPRRCAAFVETDPRATCFAAASRPSQVERLLGPEYAVFCDGQLDADCVGVRRSFGEVTAVRRQPLPAQPCHYLTTCSEGGNTCDLESSVIAVDVQTAAGALSVVAVHPSARGKNCRLLQIEQAFAAAGPRAIVAGDWNFDPDRTDELAEGAVEARWAGEGARFSAFHPRNESCQLEATRGGNALDRVYGDFPRGTCTIQTLASRAEGAILDHLAVICDLAEGR
jgi:endonuclease/exonuclease/phosphatase family metal-dependent hydrolase